MSDSILTLSLLVVRCTDLALSRRFYQALGLAFTAEQHGTGPLHYSAQLGTTVLELYPAGAAPTTVRLGFGVADVAAAVQSLRAIGAQVDREPTDQTNTALVRDPDNNVVELSPA